VSSRPRIGLRKINTSLEIGGYWINIRKSIPFWDIRAGVGSSSRQGVRVKGPGKQVLEVILDTRCWMLDAGCWMLDAGCWMLDAGCWMLLQDRSWRVFVKGGRADLASSI
jgi:hypothetical protein